MRTGIMRLSALVTLVLCGVAVAQDEARIDIRAYRVFGPLSGTLGDTITIQGERHTPELAFVVLFAKPVLPGALDAGGLSLHMEGGTLEWVGESASGHPAVLAFGEATNTRAGKPVTLRLEYPRLAYTRGEDGAFTAQVTERGEEFSLTTQLEWKDGELVALTLWMNPHGLNAEPPEDAPWTKVKVHAKEDQWSGLVFARSPANDAPDDFLLIFTKVHNAGALVPAADPPPEQFTATTKFLLSAHAPRCRRLVAKYLSPVADAEVREGGLALYTLGDDSEARYADRAAAFVDALRKSGEAELLSAPRVTLKDSALRRDYSAPAFKIVITKPGPSGGMGDKETGLGAMLRGVHPLFEEYFNGLIEASKTPGVIMDARTEVFRPEELAEGVYGVEVTRDDGSQAVRVTTGIVVALAVSSVEVEGVVELDLFVVYRVKDEVSKGRWSKKEPLPVSFPEVMSTVHYRHDLNSQPVFLAGPGPRPDEYLVVRIDVANAQHP